MAATKWRARESRFLDETVVSVALPRSEWLLLETFLACHEESGCPYVSPDGVENRLRQIKLFIIEAEQRAAREILEREPA